MIDTIYRFARVTLGMILLTSVGCSGSTKSEPEQKAVYICRETKKPVVAAVQPTPAINPATGRRTLDRALYCPLCKRWRAVPSDAASNGNPLATRCPQHRCPMTTDGPLPE